jgi:hypothetical protein
LRTSIWENIFQLFFRTFLGEWALKNLAPKFAGSVICGRAGLAALAKTGLLRFTIPVTPDAHQFPDLYIKVLGGKSLRSGRASPGHQGKGLGNIQGL